MKKVLSALLGLAVTASALAGCANGDSPAPSPSPSPEVSRVVEESYQIGLVQYQEQTTLNALREAFMSRLEEWGCDETQVEIAYQNAGGDPAKAQEICQGFVEDQVDMIVAISTPAAQAAVSAAEGTDVTVMFTGVANEAALGLDQSQEAKVTGVVSPTPVNSLVDLARQADSSLQTLGLLYDPSDPGAQAEAQRVKTYCEELGLAVVESTVSSQEEVAQAAAELCGQADAVFTPPDSTVAAAAGEAAQAAKTAGVPWYTGDSAMVQAGALASMSVTGREAGVKTADMAVQLIQGRDVAQVPVFTFSDGTTYVNQTTLEALTSLSFPAEVLQTAFVCQ